MATKEQINATCLIIVNLLLLSCGLGEIFSPTVIPSPTISPTPTATPLPVALRIPGLVLYYPFNGDARDLSEFKTDGSIQGPTLTADRFGNADQAYYFDGVDDYIAFDPSNMPLGDSPRTISAWMKAESYPPELIEGLGSRPSVIGWGLQDWDQLSEMQVVDGRLQFHTYNFDNISSSAVVELNQWYHLAIVYSEGKVYLYVNGVEEVYEAPTNDTQIGTGRVGTWPEPHLPVADWWENLGYFHGVIDDIAVFNIALSDTQIEALYEEGSMGVILRSENPGLISTPDPSIVWFDNFEDGDWDGWLTHGPDVDFYVNKGVLVAGPNNGGAISHESNVSSGTWSFDLFFPDDTPYRYKDYRICICCDQDFALGFGFDTFSLVDNTQLTLITINEGEVSWGEFVNIGRRLANWEHFDVTRDELGNSRIYLNGELILENKDDLTISSNWFYFHSPAVGPALDNVIVRNQVIDIQP